MSPLDMLIFLFLVLVTIKAAAASIDYWKDVDDELAMEAESHKRAASVRRSAVLRSAKPSAVRVTPIKRVSVPAQTSSAGNRYFHLKDKGVA